jgi:hypothetical protein
MANSAIDKPRELSRDEFVFVVRFGIWGELTNAPLIAYWFAPRPMNTSLGCQDS